jgi:coproporphyrinogen III oxidase-like Fe-S oxidoreductase
VRGVRAQNWANTVLYCEHLERRRRPVASSEALTPLGRAGEIAAFGLRMNTGWTWTEFERVTGFDLRREWAEAMAELVRRGWASHEPDRFRLTRAGLRFADAAAELFLR